MGREDGLLEELSLGKGSDGSQVLPLEVVDLLKVIAHIEVRHREKLRALRKEVA
ncbi:hypothetical protein KSD_17690 [Ktedonobacter sp. SOSP1-85]|uniref:hypothetical protein n=1 Tax=Ktedonobacter sp. SOSP1-85 TaxID=2778367 RepID=UPI0019162F30|nr:hypothetical protein [Ktedonobacter sp. SOSP1-85]GHO73998.1 hypothetical protein KSD_17690 [Ktedonobacter sp. SOSP1-85]